MKKEDFNTEYSWFLEKIGRVGQKSISIEWCSGGMEGGSCWGGESNRSVQSDPEPEFEELDEILAKVWPEINFLKYKKLVRDLVRNDSRTSNDYYGNYTTYASKTIYLFNLFKSLKEMGLKLD
jgi:hypothetical protein